MKRTIRVEIKTSQNILTERNTSIDDLQVRTQFLLDCLGKKYLDIFPTTIQYPQDIDFIIFVSNKFRKIYECEGFNRHVKLYNFKGPRPHLFVATISGFLRGISELCLEPCTPSNEGNPDIELNYGGSKIYLECKTINTEKYDDYDGKNNIAQCILGEINCGKKISS